LFCSEEDVVLAFNGGKDSVVLLYLIHIVLYDRHRRSQAGHQPNSSELPRLRAIYFLHPNSFSEVTDFMQTVGEMYGPWPKPCP